MRLPQEIASVFVINNARARNFIILILVSIIKFIGILFIYILLDIGREERARIKYLLYTYFTQIAFYIHVCILDAFARGEWIEYIMYFCGGGGVAV